MPGQKGGQRALCDDVGMARSEDRRLSFNEVPDIYDEIRPSYPADLFDVVFESLPSEPTILEVGPGTRTGDERSARPRSGGPRHRGRTGDGRKAP